ncbi:hypothetical protein ARSEF1564_007062 [Beauveria bassiana]
MQDERPGPAKPTRGGAFVVRQHDRKPLFGNATKQTTAQPLETRIPALTRLKTSPSTQPNPVGPSNPPTTPGGSRIPRFGSGGFGSRKPMSLSDAYKLAAEEEDSGARPGPIDGSPSPAPRSWRTQSGNDGKSRGALNEDPLDGKSAVSPNKERIALRNRVDDGIGKSRTSRWVLEEGMRDADAPLPPTENVAPGFKASPEKSYAWQVDEDFTAGDLQVSDSPRIRVNKPPITKSQFESPRKGNTPNTKLDEIRARELGLTPNVASARKLTKPNDNPSWEKEPEKQTPLLERGFSRTRGGLTKLDNIKQLETQGLSKRAMAQVKLEEIKEYNAMTRSVSPDAPHRQWIGREAAGIPRSKSAFEPAGRQVPDTPVTIYKSEAERVADDVRRAAAKKAEEKRKEAEQRSMAAIPQNRAANRLSPDKRDKSRDLLRKLARAAGASPAAPDRRPDDNPGANASAPPMKPEAPRASSLKRSALADSSRRRTSITSSNAAKSVSSMDRPTVGFAGLARSRSSDSRKSKRSSVHSEQDPTDRIEAEEQLFAPLDNYSEPGSVRAPSPRIEDDATPKPVTKHQVLSMPTPRAPGAFVDTPIAIKKEDREELRPSSRRRVSLEESPDIKTDNAPRNSKRDLAWRSKDVDTASDPGAAEEKPTRPARSRSLPRRRPLTNSAKLPSVRDDMHELQQLNNIDDGTLDQLEDILQGKKTTSEKLDELLKELPAVADVVGKIKSEPESSSVDENRLDDELSHYEALSASVERNLGVHNIGKTKPGVPSRTKKSQQGDAPTKKEHQLDDNQIQVEKQRKNDEQLDNTQPKVEKQLTVDEQLNRKRTETEKLPNHEKHTESETHAMDEKHGKDCPLCAAQPATRTIAYLHFPLPRLFNLMPRPRLTLLGLFLCLSALWFAAETAMCEIYCRPATCSALEPCVWSFDDPAGFGTALPVKLDQWTTGGWGAAAWTVLRDDVADVLDMMRGVDAADVERMTPAQRRRYRRRVARKMDSKTGWGQEQREKADAWRRERMEMERGILDEESVGGDERVW